MMLIAPKHPLPLLIAFFTLVTSAAHDASADEPSSGPAVAGVAGVTSEASASSDSPPSAAPSVDFELAGVVAYTTPPIRGGTSPFGIGLGGRAGLAFANGLYLGLDVVDYLGSKDVDVTDTALLYGVDVGYGFRLAQIGDGRLTLRPLVGAGGLTVFRTDPSVTVAGSGTTSGRGRVDVVSSASGGGSSGSGGNVTTVDAFYVEPGITLMYATGSFVAALNGNALVVPGIAYSGAAPTLWLSYGLQAQGGLRF